MRLGMDRLQSVLILQLGMEVRPPPPQKIRGGWSIFYAAELNGLVSYKVRRLCWWIFNLFLEKL